MPRFRKKPVEIEAVQWSGTPEDIPALHEFAGHHVKPLIDGNCTVYTLEGPLLARAGDWIIRGVQGEFYPCKPDIFEATYEAGAAGRGESVTYREEIDVSYAQDTYQEQGYDVPEEERPEITQAEARLLEALGSLIVGIETLGKRLDRVLRPAEPVAPDDAKLMVSAVRPATAQLTDFLAAQATRVESEAAHVSDMLRRLAL